MEKSESVFSEKQPTPLKEKQQRGRKMWESRAKRKDLQTQLHFIENRIRHLNQEQEKCIKVLKFTEKKNNTINSIRESHEKFKQDKIDWKLMQDQEANHKRHSLSRSRKEKKEILKEAKQNVLNRNRVNSLCVKAKSVANETLLKKIKEIQKSELKNQAARIAQSEISSKHKRSMSSQMFAIINESEYQGKLEKELQMQEDLAKKIEELSKIEEIMAANLIRCESVQDHGKNLHSTCKLIAEKLSLYESDSNVPSIV